MIIRTTLKSNLYTQILERYFDDGGPFVLKYYSSKKEYDQFKKYVKQFHNYRFGASDKQILKSKLANIIKQNFINYINSIDEKSNWHTERFYPKKIIQYKDFILRNFEIKLVDLIVDTSFNKEVVFYIYQINQYITL